MLAEHKLEFVRRLVPCGDFLFGHVVARNPRLGGAGLELVPRLPVAALEHVAQADFMVHAIDGAHVLVVVIDGERTVLVCGCHGASHLGFAVRFKVLARQLPVVEGDPFALKLVGCLLYTSRCV